MSQFFTEMSDNTTAFMINSGQFVFGNIYAELGYRRKGNNVRLKKVNKLL